MLLYHVSRKGFCTIPPIPQCHPSFQSIQVSSLHARQNKRSENVSCAAKKPEATLVSLPQELSISLTSQPLEQLKGTMWLCTLILQGTKAYKKQLILLVSSNSFSVSLQKVTVLSSVLEAYLSPPQTSPLPFSPAAPYPARSCQCWILASCYPIPLRQSAPPAPFT